MFYDVQQAQQAIWTVRPPKQPDPIRELEADVLAFLAGRAVSGLLKKLGK